MEASDVNSYMRWIHRQTYVTRIINADLPTLDITNSNSDRDGLWNILLCYRPRALKGSVYDIILIYYHLHVDSNCVYITSKERNPLLYNRTVTARILKYALFSSAHKHWFFDVLS